MTTTRAAPVLFLVLPLLLGACGGDETSRTEQWRASLPDYPTPPPGNPPDLPETSELRYPLMRLPAEVAVGATFTITVGLTRTLDDFELRMADAECEPRDVREGISVPIPGEETAVPVSVILSVPLGMRIVEPADTDQAVVWVHRAAGRASPDRPCLARFRVRVEHRPPGDKAVLEAGLWFAGAPLAFLQKEVPVLGAARSKAAGVETVSTQDPTSATAGSPPDLSIAIRPLPGEAGTFEATLHSEHTAGPKFAQVQLKLGAWDQTLRSRLGGVVRGLYLLEPVRESASATVAGLGVKLWNQLDERFRAAFWMLLDALGGDFRSIQVYSTDASFPWEMVRPTRERDGDVETLPSWGERFQVARWPIARGGGVAARKQDLVAERAWVLSAGDDLPGARAENEVVRKALDAQGLSPTLDALDEVLHASESGLLHLACHAESGGRGGADRVFLGKRSPLTTDAIVGLAARGRRGGGTVVFLNACATAAARPEGDLVEGLAPAFLEAGAPAVIATLWPVPDGEALEVAKEFYAAAAEARRAERPLLLAETLREIRNRFEADGRVTRLAYVLYGDTLARLRLR